MVTGIGLNIRQRKILAALVYEYISSGEPAGSKTLTKRYGLGVSSATIRSIMGDLEELGLVYQPHTSAGRIPTDLGIRVFVDALVEVDSLTDPEQLLIRESLGDDKLTNEGRMQITRLLSELSQQPAIVRSPKVPVVVLRQLRFVPLSSDQLLAVLVSKSGVTQSRLIQAKVDLPELKLERIHNYLNEIIPGRTLAEARQIIELEMKAAKKSVDKMGEMTVQALELGRDALEQAESKPSVVVHGQAKLVTTGKIGDFDQLRNLMELLDDQEKLRALLDATIESQGVLIVIGGEHPVTEVAECSVIAAPFSVGSEALGSLAVIGPRSMDYAKLIPIVGFAAEVLSIAE